MQKPSAWITATARAAHQLYDTPLILDDPLAVRILGPQREAELRIDAQRQQHPLAVAMRATMAVRARLAEDSARGARQYVILGAGLDTYAYRQPLLSMDSRLRGNDGGGAVRVYEVDLPAMLQWKREWQRMMRERTGDSPDMQARIDLAHDNEPELLRGTWVSEATVAYIRKAVAACGSD